MTPVQRKIVEWIINYESNHSEDDSGPVTADALRVCLAAADRCARAEADLARVTAELDEAIEDRRQARDDAARAAALLAVRTIERDARPAISREDAVAVQQDARSMAARKAWERVEDALRAHAAGSGKGGDDA